MNRSAYNPELDPKYPSTLQAKTAAAVALKRTAKIDGAKLALRESAKAHYQGSSQPAPKTEGKAATKIVDDARHAERQSAKAHYQGSPK